MERGITPDLTASINYLFVRGHDLPRTVNTNLPPPLVQSDRALFGPLRLDPTRNDVFELQPTASSTYQGVTVTVNRRLSHEIEWSAAYTWSHTTDTASDFDEQPQNPYALSAELADSRYDERHRFIASALFDLPIGDEEDRKPGEVPAWCLGPVEARVVGRTRWVRFAEGARSNRSSSRKGSSSRLDVRGPTEQARRSRQGMPRVRLRRPRCCSDTTG